MSGNYLLSIGVPLISIFFAFTFGFLWRQRPDQTHIRDWTLVYVFGVIGFAIELLRIYGLGDVVSLFSNVFHGLGALFTARGVFSRYGGRNRDRALWLLYGMGMAGVVFFTFIIPNVIGRAGTMSVAIATMLLMAAWRVLRSPEKDTIDSFVIGAMTVVAIAILIRPTVGFFAGVPTQIGTLNPGSLFVVALKLQSLLGWLAFAILFLLRSAADVTRDLEEQVRRDSMTGLLNRRGFFEKAALDLGCRARDLPCSILIVDIDHFKSINDRFGHATGDRAIQGVGTILAELPFDPIVARIGGEEFAVLLPATSLKAAALFSEGLRGSIADWRDTEAPRGLAVTASIGVAEFPAGDDLAEAMRQADIALYAAKRGGRNKVAGADWHDHRAESLLSIA
ncbi:GGDEF domain-containing protein [Aliihoeflea sp. PC F10.4]